MDSLNLIQFITSIIAVISPYILSLLEQTNRAIGTCFMTDILNIFLLNF